MGLFPWRKRKPYDASEFAGAEAMPVEHSVITRLVLSGDEHGTAEEREQVFALEERIAERVAEVGGYHDGNAFGGGEAELFTYGPDADELFVAVQQALEGFEVRPGSHAVKRFGAWDDEDARVERVELGPSAGPDAAT